MGAPSRELAQAIFHILDWRGVGYLDCGALRHFAALSGFSAGEAEWQEEFKLLCKEKGCSVRRGLEKSSFVQLLCDKTGDDFFADEKELHDIFNKLVQSLAEHNLMPDHSLRCVLKKKVYQVLKARSGKGFLGSSELRCFAELTGFAGSDEDWKLEFALLCNGSNVPVGGGRISQAVFLRMVDDTSERGCYCSDAELLSIYRWFLDSGADLGFYQLCSDSPEEPRVTVYDDNLQTPPSPGVERRSMVNERSSPPVSREMTFREILGLLSKGNLDLQSIDFGRFWDVCATSDLHRFADILDESGWVKDADLLSDGDHKSDCLPNVDSVPAVLFTPDEDARLDYLHLQGELTAACSGRALAMRECEEARMESNKLRRRIHASIDEKSNAVADAMVCKLECEEARTKLYKFKLQEGELTDKLGKFEQEEEARAKRVQAEYQALQSELRQQTISIQERMKSFQKGSRALEEKNEQLETAFAHEYTARENDQMEEAILQGTLVGMESEWLQVEALLWEEVTAQEESSGQRWMQLEAMELNATAPSQMLERVQEEYEVARATNEQLCKEEHSLQKMLEADAAGAESKLRKLRDELSQETMQRLSVLNNAQQQLQSVEETHARERRILEKAHSDLEARAVANESELSLDHTAELGRMLAAREEEKQSMHADAEILYNQVLALQSQLDVAANDRSLEDTYAKEAAEFKLNLEEECTRFEDHVNELQTELALERSKSVVSNERTTPDSQLDQAQEGINISAEDIVRLEGLEERCREEEQRIVNEAQAMCEEALQACAEEQCQMQSQCLSLREECADLQRASNEKPAIAAKQETESEWEGAFAERAAEFEANLSEVQARFEIHVNELREELSEERANSLRAKDCMEDTLSSFVQNEQHQWEKISAECFAHIEGVEARCREEEQFIMGEAQARCMQEHEAKEADQHALGAFAEDEGFSAHLKTAEARCREEEQNMIEEAQIKCEQTLQIYAAEYADMQSECLILSEKNADLQHRASAEDAEESRATHTGNLLEQEDAFAQRAAQFELSLSKARASFEAHVSELQEELANERSKAASEDRAEDSLDEVRESEHNQLEVVSANYFAQLEGVETRCREEELHVVYEAQELCEQTCQTYATENAQMQSQCLSLEQECEDVQRLRLSDADEQEEQFQSRLVAAHAIFRARESELQEELASERTKESAANVEDASKLKVECEEAELQTEELQKELAQQQGEAHLAGSCLEAAEERHASDQATVEELRTECELAGRANVVLLEEEMHLRNKLKAEAEESETMRLAYTMALPFSGAKQLQSESEEAFAENAGHEALAAHSPAVLAIEFNVNGESQIKDFTRSPLGMTFHEQLPMTVKDVRRGGHAERNCIQSGWIITKIGGTSIEHLSVKEVMDLLKEKVSPLQKSPGLDLQSPAQSPSPQSPTRSLKSELPRGNERVQEQQKSGFFGDFLSANRKSVMPSVKLEPPHGTREQQKSSTVAAFVTSDGFSNDDPQALASSSDGSKVEEALNRQLSAVLHLNRH